MNRWRITHTAITLAVVDVALFLVSGIPSLKNAKHGADYILGEAAWIAFLIGTLALLVTLAIWITRTTRQRRATVKRPVDLLSGHRARPRTASSRGCATSRGCHDVPPARNGPVAIDPDNPHHTGRSGGYGADPARAARRI